MATFLSRIELSLTVTAGAYSDGDVVGGLLTLTDLALVRGALLNKIVVVDAADQKAAFDLWLFNAAPTTFADNAAFAPTAADLTKVISRIAFAAADYQSENSLAHGELDDINTVIPTNIGVLYAYVVLNGSTPTYTATDDLWLAFDFIPQEGGR
jgi:hypothetical protein